MAKKQKRTAITLGEWLIHWEEIYAMPIVKPATLASYDCYIHKHIIPEIGNILMCKLNTSTFQIFFNQHRGVDGKTLSPKTLQNIRMMLHASLKQAIGDNLIDKNYIEFVKLPHVKRKEMRVLSITEQAHLICAINSCENPFSIGIFILLTTGMRVGELCGLKWSDINQEKRELHIQRTVQRVMNVGENSVKKTRLCVGTPKSDASNRIIPLNNAIIDKLNQFRQIRSESMHVHTDGYIFETKFGNPSEPKAFRTLFKQILEETQIKPANLHALRHTFATRALEAGIDFKTLSILMGHNDISTTMNRYAHVMPNNRRNAMDQIFEFIIK